MRRTIVFKRYNSFLVIIFAIFLSPAVISFIYLIDQYTHILDTTDKFLSNILSIKKLHLDVIIFQYGLYFFDIFLFYKYTKINIFYCFILPLSLYMFHIIIFYIYSDITQYYNLN